VRPWSGPTDRRIVRVSAEPRQLCGSEVVHAWDFVQRISGHFRAEALFHLKLCWPKSCDLIGAPGMIESGRS
jgi:hypothetical protein